MPKLTDYQLINSQFAGRILVDAGFYQGAFHTGGGNLVTPQQSCLNAIFFNIFLNTL